MPDPNSAFNEVPAPAYESSAFDYDIDEPTRIAGQNASTPPQVVGEDSLLAAFTEYENPSAAQVDSITRQYEEQGASPVIEGIRARAAKRANQTATNAEYSKYTTGEQSLQQLEDNLSNTPALTEDDFSDLHQEMMTARLFRNQAEAPLDQLVAAEKIAELVDRGYPVQAAIQDRIDWMQSKMDGGALSMTAGIAADILPFATTIPFQRAFAKVFPDQEFGFNPADYARGELANDFRIRMAQLPPDEQYQVAVDFMDAVMETDGTLTGTDFQKLMIMQEALSPEFGTTDRVIGDIISVLDLVGVGGIAKHMIKGVKSIFKPGSAISTLNIVDPKSAEQLAAQAIKKDMSETVGMSPVDLAEVVVTPNKWRSNIELLPSDIVAQLSKGDQQVADVFDRTAHNPLATTDVEQAEILRNFRNEVKDVGNSGVYGSNYTARRTDEGIEFTATYGVKQSDGTTVPFKTPKQTLDAARNSFPDAKNIVVYKRMAKGNLVPVDPLTKKGRVPSNAVGEYVYEVDGFKSYAQVANRSEDVIFRPGDVLNSGPLTKWGLDPASRFAGWISRAFGQAGDVQRGIDHSIKKIAEPFTSLKMSDQREVVKMLQKYADEAETMDTAQVIAMANGNDKVLQGFFGYRQTMDALWELENRNLRGDLLQQGAKHIVIGNYQNTGVKVGTANLFRMASETGKDILEVFDAARNSMVSLTPKQITKLHADGKSIYRTAEPAGDLSKQSNLVITSAPEHVRELPMQVLKKIDGYIPRHYKDTYFVRKVVNGTMNGKGSKNFQIMRAVGDKAEANAVVKQLVSEGKMTIEEAAEAIVHDRTLAPAERATINQQDNISLGRMFYHKRNKERLRGIDGLAKVSDPVEAMMKNIQSTSKYVANFEMLSTMKQRWMNTYGTKYGLVGKEAGFPQTRVEIGGRFTGTGAEKKEALEMFDHIRTTESISTAEGELWRNKFMDIADGIIGDSVEKGLFSGPLSSAAKFIGEKSPNHLARQLSFGLLISGNPLRQLLVQAQQFTFLTALQPTKALKVWKRGWAIRHGVLKETNPRLFNLRKDAAAKTLGLSTKQYDDYIKNFNDTGIPHSVDSHDYVAKAMDEFTNHMNDGMVAKVGRGIWKKAVTTPLGYGKKGFDHGEMVNLTTTFAAAEQRFFTRTGKTALKTKKDFAEVAADARQLALDMTHTGALRYQNGGMSALTQFLSIQHKAMLAISPFKNVGNQAFTRAERLKLLTGQVFLNGTAGLGLHKLYQSARDHMGLDLPDEVENVIVGGMLETIVNEAVELVSEGDSNLNVSGSIAPAGGIVDKAGDVLDVLMGHKPLLEIAAATNTFGRVGQMFTTMNSIRAYDELNDDVSIGKYITNFATITSGMNQALRAAAAMRLGVHVSNSGSPTTQASFASAIAEGAFGLQDRSVESFYELQDEFSNEMQNTTSPLAKLPIYGMMDEDKYTTEVAASLYGELQRIVTLFETEYDPEIENLNTTELSKLHLQRMQQAMKMQGQILALHDPVERDKIWMKFSEIAQQDRTRGADNLIDKIVKKVYSGEMSGSSAEYAINRLRASGLYDPKSEQGRQLEAQTRALQENLYMQNKLSDQNMKLIQEIEANGKN